MGIETGDALDRHDMARLCEGQGAALDDLMERHASRLFHYLIRQLHDESEAEDFTQEAFVRVFQHRDKFDPRHRFSTWLYTIATNLVRDRARQHSRRPQISLEAQNQQTGGQIQATMSTGESLPVEKMVGAERIAAVREAVDQLPDDLKTVLVLFEYEERPQAEIADILNCSRKAVEMRLYRARQQLRSELAEFL